MSKVELALVRSSEAQCVIVGAAHRFRPSPAIAWFRPEPAAEVPYADPRAMLALIVTNNPGCFEPRDVAAWTAYLDTQ